MNGHKPHHSVAETLLDHKQLPYPLHNTPFGQTHKSRYPNERDRMYSTSQKHMKKKQSNPPKSVAADVVVPNIVVRITV